MPKTTLVTGKTGSQSITFYCCLRKAVRRIWGGRAGRAAELVNSPAGAAARVRRAGVGRALAAVQDGLLQLEPAEGLGHRPWQVQVRPET